MAEFILALAGDQFSSLQIVEIGFESDSSQGNDDAQIFQSFELAFEIWSAVGQFLGQGLVARRGAASGGSDVESGQSKPVVTGGRRRLTSKPRFVQHRVHEVAGGVAGKRAAGAIGAVRAGRESEHE